MSGFIRKAVPVITALVLGTAAAALPPAVRVRSGSVEYRGADGIVRILTHGGNVSDPVLSGDQRTIAFVHLDGKPTEEGESGFTSLWIADGPSGRIRRLLASRPDNDPKRNLSSFQNPRFSLDGGFIYIDAEAWTTSAAVHQVSVATGTEHFVVDGSVTAIIRTGKYRGYLLVYRHRYYPAPRSGSYDAIYVVRPDAKETFMVPGERQG